MSFLSSLFGRRQHDTPSTTTGSKEFQQADVYRRLRSRVFEQSAGKPGLSEEPDRLIAAMMETGHSIGVSSLVCYADGSVSVYFNNGGGVIGAGEHQPVREAAKTFLELASQLAGTMETTDTFPLPRPDHVRFYSITANAVRTIEVPQEDLTDSGHKLSPLFLSGHTVLAAVRVHAPN